ncbi:MAG: DUF1800 family protein [Cytophagales bacterium]|nr:DUF1800 family protein [Cytophagales bacterium]
MDTKKLPKVKTPDLVDLFNKEDIRLETIGIQKNRVFVSNKGLTTYAGEFGKAQKMHLLNRVLVGYSFKSYQEIKGLTLKQSIDLILTQEKPFALPINDYYLEISDNADVVKADVPKGNSWVTAPEYVKDNGNLTAFRQQSLKAWLTKQFVNQKTSIHWLMVLFYHNLLVASIQNSGLAKNAFQYLETLFKFSLGNFKELIYQITLDPCMLVYLNGNQNNKNSPDENYARELQELFTVGKGADSKFTESDVTEMARLLTGWQFDWDKANRFEGRVEVFNAYYNHDLGDKQFSAFYGNSKILGAINRAENELREAIDMIFNTEETAKYICRRIYGFFVNPIIDSSIEDLIITPLAKIFKDSKFEILPVINTLLSSDHFFDTIHYNSIIKSPADFVIGLSKEFNMPLLDSKFAPIAVNDDNIYYEFKRYNGLHNQINNLGMNLGDPPNVSGWPAYYQTPAFDLFWINSETIVKRAQYTDSIFNWGNWVFYNNVTKTGILYRVDLAEYVRQFETPEKLDAVVDQLIERLIGVQISSTSRSMIIDKVMQGNSNTNYWTAAWYNFVGNPIADNRQLIQNRLSQAMSLIFQMGETHLH